jgi:hypothetical protein
LLSVRPIWPAGQAVGKKEVQKFKGSRVTELKSYRVTGLQRSGGSKFKGAVGLVISDKGSWQRKVKSLSTRVCSIKCVKVKTIKNK